MCNHVVFKRAGMQDMPSHVTKQDMSSTKTIEDREFWTHHFKQFALLDIARKAYCRAHGLNYDRFQYWFHKLNKPSHKIRPIPVTVSPAETPTMLCSLQLGKDKRLLIYDRHLLTDILARLL